MAFNIRDNELTEDVRKYILQKQVEIKAKKKHQVSLGFTINVLIREAYLKDKKQP